MHAIMKFRMRRRDQYECDVPHPLPLDGKYHMFCSRENKQSRVYKISVHYDLQNSNLCSHLKSTGILTTCVFFSRWFIKMTDRYKGVTRKLITFLKSFCFSLSNTI